MAWEGTLILNNIQELPGVGAVMAQLQNGHLYPSKSSGEQQSERASRARILMIAEKTNPQLSAVLVISSKSRHRCVKISKPRWNTTLASTVG